MPRPSGTNCATGLRRASVISWTRWAVLLGRAGAVVLAGHPAAFHIRLDGPEERRLARAAAFEGIDEITARNRLVETDRARARYVQRLYGRSPDDPLLYHLVIDSTVLSSEDCVEVIAAAAESFWRRNP